MSEVKYLDKTGLGTVWGNVKALVNPKADKSEMSVTPGTGTDADKTMIQLKQGTSATVLTQHQDISGKADKDADAVEGHLAKFDANGNPVDGDIAINNVAQKDGSYDQMQVGVAKDLASSQSVPAEIVFRNTGGSTSVGKGGTAIINKFKGKTLVWNQLVPISYIDFINTQTDTLTFFQPFLQWYNDSGLITSDSLSGSIGKQSSIITAPSGSSSIRFKHSGQTADIDIIPRNTISGIIAGHKYYISFTTLSNNPSTAGGLHVINNNLIDLTLLYGSEIDGMTDAEILAKYESEYTGYHDYNPGTLISNDASAIETVGFNQWDEEVLDGYYSATGTFVSQSGQLCSKNLMPVIPGSTYYFRFSVPTYAGYLEYDGSGNFLRRLDASQTITFSNDAYFIKFNFGSSYGATYNHDICINISDPAMNGTYEPYWKSQVQLNLDDFYVKDPSGGADIHITGGLKSAGDVYDEIVGNKYIKRVGSVDLGSLNWSKAQDGRFYSGGISQQVYISAATEIAKGICSKYKASTDIKVATEVSILAFAIGVDGYIYVRDPELESGNADAFRVAMQDQDVILYYALATPIEYELVEALPTEYRVDSHGTERRLPEDTASSVHAPFCAEITYSTNIKETVENLPKNYINVDSMHAFLAALGTAMNGEWDMRQGNGRFIFTFTPNTSTNENE